MKFFTTKALILSTTATSVMAQTSPYCAADLVPDQSLNFLDVSQFLTDFSNGNLAIDYDNSGTLNFLDVSLFLDIFANCPDLTDTDNDRIPDFAETNNGLYIDLNATGTDPLNPDTDGDFLNDGDEVLGTVDGLILPDANPVRKDIYIECDWFAGTFQGRTENYRPTPAVDARVTQAFANASTPNPYGGAPGINLHLDYGQGGGHTGGNHINGNLEWIAFDSEFNIFKGLHFDPSRKGYYHYAIFANRYNNSSNRSSGIAEINGDDFMVTMVDYNSTVNMANTIAHELGHNLGLRHGGNENRNYKPNYNSVMNYRHQFPGIDTTGNSNGNGVLDYSRGTNIDLDESHLIDTHGVTGGSPSIDWNRNGFFENEAFPYAANINCDFWFQPCGSGSDCYDSTCDVLEDYDDWSNINWNRLNQSSDRHPELQQVECENWPGK